MQSSSRSTERGIWRQFRRVPSVHLPRRWRSWVLDKGSLTQRLIRCSRGDFRVQVNTLRWGVPHLNERCALGMAEREVALIREVDLICQGRAWVCARSVIPVSTLSGDERQLKYLGTRPLGAFLFRSRSMQRLPIEIARLSRTDGIVIYGRRSVFLLHGKPLLVNECFLPALDEAGWV